MPNSLKIDATVYPLGQPSTGRRHSAYAYRDQRSAGYGYIKASAGPIASEATDKYLAVTCRKCRESQRAVRGTCESTCWGADVFIRIASWPTTARETCRAA